MESNSALRRMAEELEQLKLKSQFRELHSNAASDQGWTLRDGRRMLDLSSNHYLGLTLRLDEEPWRVLRREADEIGSQMRFGATASRLIAGNDPVFERFEREFARFKGCERCLLFSSGYMANIGIISALVGRHDLVFSDRLNHASIVDGIALSRAESRRYAHRDLNQLEALLKKAPGDRNKLIVTDAVFSMDGSIAPLSDLVMLKNRYGALLMVDEAHSGGLFGENGAGLAHELGLGEQIDVHMGTFSKAYGCYGAYAAGNETVISYLVNKARSFIYTTGLPPLLVLAARHNWRRSVDEPWRRSRLHAQAARFRERLTSAGFDTGLSETQIVPLIVGENELAVKFGAKLQEEGIAAVAIRPPTVPEGTARIRFSLMATHEPADLEWAAERIIAIGGSMGLISFS